MNTSWLQPQWPAPANVRAVCTTRAGGVSAGPYASLNLGDHVGDDAPAVQANRAILQQAMDAHPVFLNQVHGTQVARLTGATPQGLPADACLTDQQRIACTVMVADCLPVLLTNETGRLVAAAHAGWRGLAGQAGLGVLESVVNDFRVAAAKLEEGPGASALMAWLGPCIGPAAFEVGSEVRAAFVAHDPAAQVLFKSQPGDRWLADLPALARQRLAALGVSAVYGNDGSPVWCTVSQPSRFFSHRRDRVSGRLAACIWRV